MKKVLIIGCTDITRLIVPILCSDKQYVSELCIASKNKTDCDEYKKKLSDSPVRIVTAGVDVTNEEKTLLMVKIFGPSLIVNLAPPHLNKIIMELALKIGSSYIDAAYYTNTAANTCLAEDQYALNERFKMKGLSAIIGCAFNPGIISVFVRDARRNIFDFVDKVDIIDVNAGTNDNPNLMNSPLLSDIAQLSNGARYISEGKVVNTPALRYKTGRVFPGVGKRTLYLLDDCVIDCFQKDFPVIGEVRYFSSFKKQFLSLIRALDSVGMLSREPVEIEGAKISPIDFLARVLPQKDQLASTSKGNTGIGCIISGRKDGQQKDVMYYCTADHAHCFDKYGISANSYFAAVAVLTGVQLFCTEEWNIRGVITPAVFDPEAILDKMRENGLEYKVLQNVEPIVLTDCSEEADSCDADDEDEE